MPGLRVKLENLPEQPGDVPRTWADVAKAGRMLGYAPKVTIEEGIGKFVQWMETQ